MSFQKGDIILRDDARYPEGALVVSGYGPGGELLAHPKGGGLELRIPASEISRFAAASEAERTRIYRKSRFSIEEVEATFAGWWDGERWNGWAMPSFEIDEARKVLDALAPKANRFDPDHDSFVTWGADGEEIWPAESIMLADGGTAKVYPVGAGSWIWEEVQPDAAEPETRQYRTHPQEYQYASRDFVNGDRVVFVGPPDEQHQPTMIAPPEKHKLLGRQGTVMIGPSEDIRCFPDDPESDLIWIRFDGDKHPFRQVSRAWVVRESDHPGTKEAPWD